MSVIVFLSLSTQLLICNLFPQTRSETVDLNTDTSLMVDISDAVSERDKVKFTVHSKVSFPVDDGLVIFKKI